MPAIRQPLRSRCNISLSVVTSPSASSKPSKVDTHRGRPTTLKPRHQQPKHRRRLNGFAPVPSSTPLPTTNATQEPHTLESFHTLIPSLSLAFSSGFYTPSTLVLPASLPTTITHFVKLIHATTRIGAGRVWPTYDESNGTHTLTVVVPAPSPSPSPIRDRTVLTDNQLLVTRDFLSLALPYYSEAHAQGPPSPISPFTSFSYEVLREQQRKRVDPIHALITAPPGEGSAVDIMSVAACYLSFASEEPARTVLRYIDEEVECVAGEWRGVVGEGEGEGVEVIERVATMGM